MNCFGTKTQKRWKNETCGSYLLYIYIYKIREEHIFFKVVRTFFFVFLFILFSLASLFDIRKSDLRNSSGQERKGSTRRGLRMGTKNMGFRRVLN